MSGAAFPFYTKFEDYFEGEGSSDVKHEWCDGVVYAMSRGTPEHARLTMSIGRVLGNALTKDCTIYGSEAMLYVEGANLSTYADVTVVCGPLETKTVRKNGRSLGEAIINPTIVIEVLSDSTERYDRDGKFQAYKRLPSLEEYVLVSQDEPRIEVYRRPSDPQAAWGCETSGPGGSVTVRGSRVEVDAVYG